MLCRQCTVSFCGSDFVFVYELCSCYCTFSFIVFIAHLNISLTVYECSGILCFRSVLFSYYGRWFQTYTLARFEQKIQALGWKDSEHLHGLYVCLTYLPELLWYHSLKMDLQWSESCRASQGYCIVCSSNLVPCFTYIKGRNFKRCMNICRFCDTLKNYL